MAEQPELAQMPSRCLLWVETGELAEVSMEHLRWVRMPTERVESVEAASSDLGSDQT